MSWRAAVILVSGVFGGACTSNDSVGSHPFVTDAGCEDCVDASEDVADAPVYPAGCSADWCVAKADVAAVSDHTLLAAFGTAKDDVWAVGDDGSAIHFDGKNWTTVATGTHQTLYDVWQSSATDVWIASTGDAFLHGSNATGPFQVVDGGWKGAVYALRGFGPTDITTAGEQWVDHGLFNTTTYRGSSIWRYEVLDGAAGVQEVTPCGGVVGADAAPPNGRLCPTVRAVWLESTSASWFVGDNGRTFHGDTHSPQTIQELDSATDQRLTSVIGFAPNDVWAVGARGVIRHWSGSRWDVVASPTTEDLHRVWGAGADDVWAVGNAGIILHFNGAVWTVSNGPWPTKTSPALWGIWGSGPADIWLVGDRVIAHRSSSGGQ